MAKPVLEVEARMEDFITKQMKTIENNFQNFQNKLVQGNNQAAKSTSVLSGQFTQAKAGIMSFAAQFAPAALAVGAVYGAYNALSGLLKTSLSDYKAQVDAQQALRSALGYTSTGLEQLASDLQAVTRYGDETAMAAMSMVAAFIKDENTIKKLMPVIADLAAAKKMDLVAAADLVTKSVASETNALMRYGIKIEGAAGSTERAASAAKALTAAFGGMAENLAKTDVGRLDQMNNRVGDIREEIGERIIPMQIAWAGFVLKTVEAANKLLGIFIKTNKELTLSVLLEQQKATALAVERAERELNAQNGITLSYTDRIAAQARYNDALNKQKQIELDIRKAKGLSETGEAGLLAAVRRQGQEKAAENERQLAELEAKKAAWAEKSKVLQEQAQKNAEESEKQSYAIRKANIDAFWAEVDRVYLEQQEIRAKTRQTELDINQAYNEALYGQDEWQYMQQLALWEKRAIQFPQYADKINLIIEQLNKKHNDSILLSDKMRKDEIAKNAKAGLDMTVNNLQIMARENKKYMALYKTLATVQAIIDTYSSAQAAYKAMAGIPYVGPALGFVAAAAAVAAGLINISKIQSAKFATGTAYAPGGQALVGERGMELVAGPKVGYLPRGSQVINNRETMKMLGGNSVNINVTIPESAVVDRDAAELILDRVDRIKNDLIYAQSNGLLNLNRIAQLG